MKKTFFIFVFAICGHLTFAQSLQDTIVIKRSQFMQNGALKPKQLLEITKDNPIAFEHMQEAQKNVVPASILGFIGGFGIGYSLGSLVGGKDMNWTIFGVGAGSLVASIPFSSAYAKHAKKAVLAYNEGLQKTGYKKVYLESILGINGIGLKATF